MSHPASSSNITDFPEAHINTPSYVSHPLEEPVPHIRDLITSLGLIKHPEGGYYSETDRSPFTMEVGETSMLTGETSEKVVSRNYSTLIYYLLSADSPVGKMHKNKNRIIHILQKGRGQYVLVHPDGRVQSFIVGFDYEKGEVSQWVVPGGVYKASFVLPLPGQDQSDAELLISEVVVPGFDFVDHEFMPDCATLHELVGPQAASLEFLVRGKSNGPVLVD